MLGAAAATGGCARALFQLSQCVHALFVDRFDDDALANANAAAYDFGVGHFGNVGTSVFRRTRKKKLPAPRSQIVASAKPVHVAVAVACIANQDSAGESAVAEREFLVDPQGGIFVADDVRARRSS